MAAPVTRIPAAQPALRAVGAGFTHAGRRRGMNEDAILTDPAGALWAVADGLGGLGHGDVAADIVIDALARLPHGSDPADLAAALREANAAIRRRARDEGLGEMAATIVAAQIDGARATLAWAGDSRGYLARAGGVERVTRDHSVVQELIDRGGLAEAEAETHPQAHVVTRAVGAEDRLEPEMRAVDLRRGDVILLCSDGLTRCVPDRELAATLARPEPPETLARALMIAALDRGAPDNVSVIVVRIEAAG
ncbi:protein phosphatase 2C domain-containing protein [Amaricoccus sp.]|uniref:PP2C family protein-serine/threonine phosphatase n=1 Tax=Amaricoccus sp. TaxID=1872485 RepID=UPI001B7C046B|nr:protein phosphatase 2C domain-containing protein [Amaricoccus sp.]MBP7003300.1 serine/threonine-protein phosphatase [Amaricoccus sp.]